MASMSARFPDQADLEVVPPETGLYPLPTSTPLYAVPQESFPKEQPAAIESAVSPQTPVQTSVQTPVQAGNPQTPAQVESQTTKDPPKTILGLSVTVFWALIIALFIILAAGIGGGVGGGLSAQGKSVSSSDASRGDSSDSSGSGGTATTTVSSTAPSPTASSTTDSLVPTDGGCPGINGLGYTPYSADGKPIPLRTGEAPQEFKEQCYTNWVNTANTHDILRTYTPTLENCIVVCAEYNKAYATNLENNRGVGGGPCVAVTIVKEHAGFCYLKNGTGTNDTMGSPGSYSSAVLVTSDS
ncbi:hypothetical protein GQX73_g10700 [Xylaria multiplex]|uniref:Apple domain-containing protein n=1 Tax=Xylaria multiplex TaxID=323545 RepID=A0A7C8MKG3_9PEZI|nr:hypothetical protein GQX73_g10700 [Xylaria multiplex]